MSARAWNLTSRGLLLGRLVLRDVDFPFLNCDFEPTPAFSSVADVFAAELKSLNEGDTVQWEEDYQKVDELGLVLTSPDGGERIDDFLLHVDGATAWFRY